MARLEEFVLPAQQKTRDAFVQGYPHPFLLRRHAEGAQQNEWQFKTQTASSTRGGIAQLVEAGLELAREVADYEVFAVTKTQNNPWRDRVSLGRARNNDIVLLDNSVSKLHAHFSDTGQGWTLCDAGSRNGTRVNDEPAASGQPHDVRSNDMLVFGRIETTFLDAGGLFDFLSRHMSRRK